MFSPSPGQPPAFFEAHLEGDAEGAKSLTKEGLQPYLRGKIDTVDVLFQ
jgi:hypothetical protein